jgi:uncharacterized protein (UPF0276 family)
MKALIATPLSHLFLQPYTAELLQERSDCLECRHRTVDNQLGRQEAFHCDLQPIHKLAEEDFQYLERVRDSKPELKLVSFHLASCYQNPALVQDTYRPQGRLLGRREMLENAEANLRHIRGIFGDGVCVAVENNNYYPMGAYEIVTDGDFITELVRGNDIRFLFDTSHARITSFYRGVSFESYRDSAT